MHSIGVSMNRAEREKLPKKCCMREYEYVNTTNFRGLRTYAVYVRHTDSAGVRAMS